MSVRRSLRADDASAERLAEDLSALTFNDLRVPLVTNVDAAEIKSGEEARDALVRQVSSPVRWQNQWILIGEGVEDVYRGRPGKVLSGLLRQIKREARS